MAKPYEVCVGAELIVSPPIASQCVPSAERRKGSEASDFTASHLNCVIDQAPTQSLIDFSEQLRNIHAQLEVLGFFLDRGHIVSKSYVVLGFGINDT